MSIFEPPPRDEGDGAAPPAPHRFPPLLRELGATLAARAAAQRHAGDALEARYADGAAAALEIIAGELERACAVYPLHALLAAGIGTADAIADAHAAGEGDESLLAALGGWATLARAVLERSEP